MTLFEVFSYGATPYEGRHELIIQINVKEGERPYQPNECPSNVYKLMSRCWEADSRRRPDFYEITSVLETFQREAKRDNPLIRDIGMLATGVEVSPYSDLAEDHKTYSEFQLISNAPAVQYSMYARLPSSGPGAPPPSTPLTTYEALDVSRAIYGEGLGGSKYVVPGLDPNASYYHGVCSRPVAERALLSQGRIQGLDGVYLIRQSPRGQGQMVLSMVYDKVVWHYKMQHIGGGRYHYYGKEYDNIQHIIDHHKVKAEKMLCLLKHFCSRF